MAAGPGTTLQTLSMAARERNPGAPVYLLRRSSCLRTLFVNANFMEGRITTDEQPANAFQAMSTGA